LLVHGQDEPLQSQALIAEFLQQLPELFDDVILVVQRGIGLVAINLPMTGAESQIFH
jgi:hypothetical protein